MAITGTAMTGSSNLPPLTSHQHLKPSWRWSGVSAREIAHQIAVHASPRTCHARTHVFATHSAKMTLTRTTTITNQIMTVMVNVLCSILNVVFWYLWTRGTSVNSKIIDVTSYMLCSIQLFGKNRFQVKMFGLFLSYCSLCILDHILSYCIRFLDLENVCSDTKIMCLWCLEAEILPDFRKKVAILKIHDGGHRVLGKNVNIVFQIQ